MNFFCSVIARRRPSAKEKITVDIAKTTVQRRTRRNGRRYSGSVTIFENCVKPL